MRQIIFISIVLLLVLPIGWERDVAVHAWQEPQNLLKNPGFEQGFFQWSGINEIYVAHEWTPWWRTRTDADPPATYFTPEYKKADGYVFSNRVHSGTAAQQWFTFYSTHQAGMYQQVSGVTPGTRYRFTIWAQVWSSTEDDPLVSFDPAYPNLQIGIDPTGNWNPWDGDVVWSGTAAFYDSWGQLTVEAVARESTITVFMRSEPIFSVKHNDMYWDDAVLVAVDGGSAPPPPPPPPHPPPTPAVTCTSPPADWSIYHVQRGDTLFRLAKSHGTTLDTVISANCLQTTDIYVGQELWLPTLPATNTPRPVTATPIPPTSTPRPTAQAPTDTSRPTQAPTNTSRPTVQAPSSTPTVAPATLPPTVVPVTLTSTPDSVSTLEAEPTRLSPSQAPDETNTPIPIAEISATPTQPPPTIAPPPTSTPGSPPLPPTSTPSGSSTRPCGTTVLSAGIVLLAGVFGRRRRGGVI